MPAYPAKKPSRKTIARRRIIYKAKLKLRKLKKTIPAIMPSAGSSNDPAPPAETAKAGNNASTQRRHRRAKANAETKGADVSSLFVKLGVVGEGPSMKRFIPKARGSAGRILKRTSHIKIVLSDEK